MAIGRETTIVFAAGIVQGVALVTFPAASTIFTSPDYYNLSSSAYGIMFLPQAVMAIAASLLGASLTHRLGIMRIYSLPFLGFRRVCIALWNCRDHERQLGSAVYVRKCTSVHSRGIPGVNDVLADGHSRTAPFCRHRKTVSCHSHVSPIAFRCRGCPCHHRFDSARRAPYFGILAFGLAGLGCSALLPLTISFGQGEPVAITASVAGFLIAFYQMGYGLAVFGVGPLEARTGLTLNQVYSITAAVALVMAALSFVVEARNKAQFANA